MSFVPKYLINRLLPNDCLVAAENGVELNAINVMMPITIEEIPPNFMDYFDIELDGEKKPREFVNQMTLTVEGKTIGIDNVATEFLGMTIPMGAAMKMFIPIEWQTGEEHEIAFDVKAEDTPMTIRVKRTVQ
jgi:hypothetical protein